MSKLRYVGGYKAFNVATSNRNIQNSACNKMFSLTVNFLYL